MAESNRIAIPYVLSKYLHSNDNMAIILISLGFIGNMITSELTTRYCKSEQEHNEGLLAQESQTKEPWGRLHSGFTGGVINVNRWDYLNRSNQYWSINI